jgi:transposase
MQSANCPQRHTHFQREGTSAGTSARLQTSAYRSSGLPGSRTGRGLAGAFAPQTQEVRQGHESVELGDLAEVSFEGGLTKEQITGETVRATLARLGVRWERAKRWITSPDPEYQRKKASFASDRLIRLSEGRPEWVVGFLDETWWSRLARPALKSWRNAGETLHLIEQSVEKDDPDPKALSCYGLYLPELKETWLRFVDGRPVSSITTQFLSWCCHRLKQRSKEALLLIWDNASWHKSHERSEAGSAPTTAVSAVSGHGIRIVPCLLPTKSPWLNAIEPQWIHSKRKLVEPERLLGAYELAERVCTRVLNFGELRQREVRRIPLLRGWVNNPWSTAAAGLPQTFG